MNLDPKNIFKEYSDLRQFKASIGEKGIYEQSRINERFYAGDQWHGVRCGSERPLVRHNIIKRIGDFKMSQIMSSPLNVTYSADGIINTVSEHKNVKELKSRISRDPDFRFVGNTDTCEINTVMSALSDYRRFTAERLGFEGLCAKALRNAYISGSTVMYTYWDSELKTSGDSEGDIRCEVLDIENVYFADPYLTDTQRQPYIIIASVSDVEQVKREARRFGMPGAIRDIERDSHDGKVTVLTKLYKEYSAGGTSVKCVKVTKSTVLRRPFDTGLRMYPVALFAFGERRNLIYGDSEITHLIPNQIAINRMITANVWAAMTMGMPMMVVNGDSVTGDITNDPGQIIKVFGSNEDVAGAVRYVSPPDFSGDLCNNVNTLIENTLSQSGASAVALGDIDPDNAAAITALHDAAVMPLTLVKNRFYGFVEEISRIWADFWLTNYGMRRIRVEDENGVWFMPFDAERYSRLYLTARVDVAADTHYTNRESVEILGSLYDRGIITKKQYLKRLPQSLVPDIRGLLEETPDSFAESEEKV